MFCKPPSKLQVVGFVFCVPGIGALSTADPTLVNSFARSASQLIAPQANESRVIKQPNQPQKESLHRSPISLSSFRLQLSIKLMEAGLELATSRFVI